MRRFYLIAALILAGAGPTIAADEQAACNDQNVHQADNIAACDRAIASNQFSGQSLRDLYFNRARHWSAQRESEKGFVDNSRALQIDPRNPVILERTFLSALAAGRIDDAATLARAIVAIQRNHRISHLVLGVQGIKFKQYAVAQQNARQSLDGVGLLLSAWASFGAGDVKAALATIDRPNSAPWYQSFREFNAGLMLDLANRSAEAGARYERAYRLDDGFRRADAYARWLSRNRDAATAEVVYVAFGQKYPGYAPAAEALRSVRAGDKLPPPLDTPQAGAAEVLSSMGSTMAGQGGEDAALVLLQLALYLQPNDASAQFSLAHVFTSVKKPQLAIDVYRRVSTGSPFWRNAQVRIASNLAVLGRTDEGSRLLRSLIADSPGDIDAITALGDIQRGEKQFVACAQTYSDGINSLTGVDPARWVIFYYRGICRERSRQWTLAEPDLRKALELQPDQPQVLNYLGYSLVDQGLKTDEAMAMIRRSVEQRPDDGYIVDSLGWAYFRTGNLAEAERNLKRAAELIPGDPTIRRHLGDTFWRLGLKSQARAEWGEARKLNPEAEELALVEDRVRDGLPDAAGDARAKQAASAPLPAATAAVQPEKPVAAPRIVIPVGRRVALVIGNSEYRSVPALANPRRDAQAVADALRRVGFQSVTLVNDATRDRMVEAVRTFATEADRADWALIYYAGHGIEVGGLNYLIPVDAKLVSDRDVQFEAVGLEQVMSSAEGASKLRVVMLDACRDNPFANAMKRSVASRSVGRGLGQVEPDAGMLLVYAAKHGQIAFDGDGGNSPFVSAFVKRVTTPQIEIRKLFDLVRDDVMAATRRQQQPFTYGSVPGSEDFYFLTTDVAARP